VRQYFERAVFDWNPGGAGAWSVLLHRLGAELAAGREQEAPFRPVAPGGDAACTFHAATGHRLCQGFRAFWEGHGGLPTFGYALSEEFGEGGFVVQYFERARFEWHPENAGTEYEILLGRLGADAAARAGIDTAPAARPDGVPDYDETLFARPVPPFMEDLGAELRAMLSGWDGQNAVSVTDLQTGQTVSVNGDRQQLAACTIKIFIMMAVAQDIEAGRYTHDDVAWLVQDAMGPSHTPPARELIRYAGGGDIGAGIRRINGIMQSLGMTRSVLAHPPAYPWEDYGYGGENWLTTDDLNRALGRLWRGEALSPWATEYVLWSMTLAIPGQQYSLGGGIPAEADLYHKIGLLYAPINTWNDAGIVAFWRGGQHYAYAISYLGTGAAEWQTHYYRGADLSSSAWWAFSNAYS
jgi:beta-lactamase class A